MDKFPKVMVDEWLDAVASKAPAPGGGNERGQDGGDIRDSGKGCHVFCRSPIVSRLPQSPRNSAHLTVVIAPSVRPAATICRVGCGPSAGLQ